MSKLLAGLGGEGQKGLGAARKELEQLERKAMPVEAPLPSNIAKRVERKVEPDAVQEATRTGQTRTCSYVWASPSIPASSQ